MKKIGSIIFFNKIIFLIGLLISLNLMANRKVTIPTSSQLSISNPSSVSVNFNLTCSDKNGVTTITKTNETLAAGKTNNYSSTSNSGVCTNGFSPSGMYSYPSNMVLCTSGSSIAITSASSVCSTGNHVCTLEEAMANKGSTNYGGFAQPPTNWSRYYWDGSAYVWQNLTNGSGTYYSSLGCMQNDKCSVNGTQFDYCCTTDTSMSPNTMSILCCNDFGPSTMCKVEITTSSSAAYLASPQFNGGKPF